MLEITTDPLFTCCAIHQGHAIMARGVGPSKLVVAVLSLHLNGTGGGDERLVHSAVKVDPLAAQRQKSSRQ